MSSTSWAEALRSNFTKYRWTGRNRPATGGGATSSKGVVAPPSPPPLPPGALNIPGALGVVLNPHLMAGQSIANAQVFASSVLNESPEAHAPANRVFTGLQGVMPSFAPAVDR